MSRSFTEPAFSRTATYRVKQLTTSTQNTFPFQNCHSCFGWKNTMSSAQIGGLLLLPLRLPRPWAPPTDTSPSSRCRRGEGQGHLRAGKWWWGRCWEERPRLASWMGNQPGWCGRAGRVLTPQLASVHFLSHLKKGEDQSLLFCPLHPWLTCAGKPNQEVENIGWWEEGGILLDLGK